MSIAKRLQWARETAGMSQRRLAKLAELGDATVRHLETGVASNIELRTAQKIAGALGCSVAWLMLGDGEPPSEESLIALRESSEGAAE